MMAEGAQRIDLAGKTVEPAKQPHAGFDGAIARAGRSEVLSCNPYVAIGVNVDVERDIARHQAQSPILHSGRGIRPR